MIETINNIVQLGGYKDFDDFFNWKWLQNLTKQLGYTIGIFVWLHLLILIFRIISLPIVIVAAPVKRRLNALLSDLNLPT